MLFNRGIIKTLVLTSIISLSLCAIEQNFENQKRLMQGFSESARFETRDPVGISFNIFFNEYQANQDSNIIALKNSTAVGFTHKAINFSNHYHPGFQIGFSVDIPLDEWDFGGEYLYFRGHSKKEKYATGEESFLSPIFIGTFYSGLTSIVADWRLAIDMVDLTLSRAYYEGAKLTIDPHLGLKLGSIRQNYDLSSDVLYQTSVSQTAETKSRSLGIGPKIGSEASFLMGKGFSIFGDLNTSLLYTRYTSLEAKYSNSEGRTAFITNNNYGTVRPTIDSGIGLLWKGYFGLGTGDYSWHKTFYVSVSAAYNFSIFFSQNVEMGLATISNQSQSTPGNLYLQGVSLGLDFIF